jgi:hypothetical protein
MNKNSRIVLGALLLVFLGGCGSPHVKVKGRLLKNGEPYIPKENEFVVMEFVAAEEAKDGKEGSFVASFNREDGTFEVMGATGKGLPPGKYRACLQVLKKKKDILKGAFNAKNSPFLCTVETGKEELTFDLAKTGKAP